MSDNRFSRRYFFYGSLLAGAVPAGGFGSAPSLQAAGFKSVLEKLNIAGIGIGGRGADDLATAATSENIVALCDVNDEYAAHTFNLYPKAKRYKDFRKMIETEGKDIDAVMIATPEHPHGPVRHAARQARLLRKAARAHGLGSAPAARCRGEIQGRHANGQSGILPRRDPHRF
jgi:hypothetical protein